MFSKGKVVRFFLASSLGTYLEFLDFMLYAFASRIIAYHFFPNSDQQSALILTWGLFFVAFLVRPIGSVFFGHIGDKLGTRVALTLSMVLMSLSTVLIGFLPTYHEIGVWGSLGLMVLRMVQGFSFSAEYTGAATYLSLIKVNRFFGMITSMTIVSICLGQITASVWMSYLMVGFSPETLPEWRWRMPFIVSGLLVGVMGLVLRLGTDNIQSKKIVPMPLKHLLQTQSRALLFGIGTAAFVGVKSYALFAYIPTHLQTKLGYSMNAALDLVTECTVVVMVTALLSGVLSLFFEYVTMLRSGLIIMAVASIGFFFSLHGGWPGGHGWLFVMAAASGLYSGIMPAYLTKAFAQEQRLSGSALAHNGGAAIGGSTPLIMTVLSEHSLVLPGCYVAMMAFLVLILLRYKDSVYEKKTMLGSQQDRETAILYSQPIG